MPPEMPEAVEETPGSYLAAELGRLQAERQRLEADNASLLEQIDQTSLRIARHPNGPDVALILNTPAGVLSRALDIIHREELGYPDLPTIITAIEKDRLEDESGIRLVEPGRGVEFLIRQLEESLAHEIYMSAPEAQVLVEEAVEDLRARGHFTAGEARRLRSIAALFPREHLEAAFDSVEMVLPFSDSIKILTRLSRRLRKVADQEMALRVDEIVKTVAEARVIAGVNSRERRLFLGERISSLMAWVVGHEIAEKLWAEVLTPEEREAWNRIADKALTPYASLVEGGKKKKENFCEMYSLYILNGPLYRLMSVFSESYRHQYQFFRSLMPEGSRSLPAVAGVMYPVVEFGMMGTMRFLERVTGQPTARLVEASLRYTYDPAKKKEVFYQQSAIWKELFKQAWTRIQEFVIGNDNPVAARLLKETSSVQGLLNEHLERHPGKIRRARRMYRLLAEGGQIESGYERAAATEHEGHPLRRLSHNQPLLMSVYGLVEGWEELAAKNHLASQFLFLEDTVEFVTPEGAASLPYRGEVQTWIDERLAAVNFDRVVPLTYEVKQEARRALDEPKGEAVRALERRYKVKLIPTQERAFSDKFARRLDVILARMPGRDLQRLEGFRREADSPLGRKGLRRVHEDLGRIVRITDVDAAEVDEGLAVMIAKELGAALLLREPDLARRFIGISGWKKGRLAMHQRFIQKVLFGQSDYFRYTRNPSDSDSFLTDFDRVDLVKDFADCYAWFVLYRDEFAELAAGDPILGQKFSLFEEYFGDSSAAGVA